MKPDLYFAMGFKGYFPLKNITMTWCVCLLILVCLFIILGVRRLIFEYYPDFGRLFIRVRRLIFEYYPDFGRLFIKVRRLFHQYF